MLEVSLHPKRGFLTSPKRRDLLKGVKTEKSGNHIWLRKCPNLRIAGGWEMAEGKRPARWLSSSSSLDSAGWQEGRFGASSCVTAASSRLLCSDGCAPATI